MRLKLWVYIGGPLATQATAAVVKRTSKPMGLLLMWLAQFISLLQIHIPLITLTEV